MFGVNIHFISIWWALSYLNIKTTILENGGFKQKWCILKSTLIIDMAVIFKCLVYSLTFLGEHLIGLFWGFAFPGI